MASRGVSLTLQYTAWNTLTNAPQAGDAANHTLRWTKDGTLAAPTNAAAEADPTNAPGEYKLTLTAAECTCDLGKLAGKSSTAGVVLIPIAVSFEQLPTVAAGASGGLLVAGANAGPFSIAGGVTFSNAAGDAFACISTGGNGRGINASGNGTSEGIKAAGGTNGGSGVGAYGGATNSYGHIALGAGTGAGVRASGGATAPGLLASGGTTSGPGALFSSTGGDGILAQPTAGHGINAVANGTSKHGINATGGTAGTSDGLHATAGTGGVDVRGNLTGNVTGNLTGSVGAISGVTFPTRFPSLVIDTNGRVDLGLIVGNATAAANLQAEALALKPATVSADQAPTTTTFTSATAGLAATAGDYVNSLVVFSSGTAAPLARKVTGYTSAAGIATFTVDPPLPAAPAAGDSVLILGYAP